ncbi:hypothetical protein GCM10009122_42170 [Fulvivirga kasyanovii]|uniref:hypothetical protein n=1 Tax=Fulvivirga kasyanovii TaxID=396812 RepID=UPI0031D7D4FE
MKSKQVNFYSTIEELLECEKELKKSVVVIGLPIYDKNIIISNSIESALNKYDWPYHYRITKQEFVDDLQLKYVESQNYYLIDSLRSPVIELTVSTVDMGNEIARLGRLFYYQGYYGDNGNWIAKDEKFLKWANDYTKSFSKAMKYAHDGNKNLISKVVSELHQEGKITLKN